MARMRPELNEKQLAALQERSQAEANTYCACRDQLPERCLVLHSLSWVWPDASGTPRDGEADFIIFDPSRGVLVIEVKGGGVRVDARTDAWISIGSGRRVHEIKNPFKQVVSEKYAVLGQLKAHGAWQRLGSPRVLLGHAVLLPDVDDVLPLATQQRPRQIIGGRGDLRDVNRWIATVFRYWDGTDARSVVLGERGMRAIEEIFCTSVEVRPLVSVQLKHEEQQRIRLTSQQAKILKSLGNRNRAAVCGGAGTGKTIIAYQKAKDAAAAGMETLLLCYNRPLADHLQEMVGQTPNLRAMDFHQLCDWRARTVKARTHRDVVEEARRTLPAGDMFDDLLPHALCLTLEELDDQYDAIIVDEAQDFRDSFWLPIDLLLRDSSKSLLYIFFDQNQAVYHRQQKFPVPEQPWVLSVNCRNTMHIHEACYRYFRGDETDPCEIDGVPIELMCHTGLQQQAGQIAVRIADLLSKQKVPPAEIVVLIAGEHMDLYMDQLQGFLLPNGVKWSIRQHGLPARVLVESVKRFKGLEAGIVFLWGLDDLRLKDDRETIYVGTSRAKSQLYLVGSEASCQDVLKAECS